MEDSDADEERSKIIAQLRKSLERSSRLMLEEVDSRARQRWMQANTNAAQVLNQVLRDMQLKDWEKRLKELEQRKRRLQGTINRLEKDTNVQTAEPAQNSEGPQAVQGGS